MALETTVNILKEELRNLPSDKLDPKICNLTCTLLSELLTELDEIKKRLHEKAR